MLLSRNASLNIFKPCFRSSAVIQKCSLHISLSATASNKERRRRTFSASVPSPKRRPANNHVQAEATPGPDENSKSMLTPRSEPAEVTPESAHNVSSKAKSSCASPKPEQSAKPEQQPTTLDPNLERKRQKRARRKARRRAELEAAKTADADNVLMEETSAPKGKVENTNARNEPSNEPSGSSRRNRYKRSVEDYLAPTDGERFATELPPPSEQRPVAQLAHGLDRVLFNPGVYWLQDPRSRVYNFSPWLQTIPKVQDFAFDRVAGFVSSSIDEDLRALAKATKSKYTGSTSSLTGILSHIYMALSAERPVDLSPLSAAFKGRPTRFTPGQKFPVATRLVYNDGVYSTDSLHTGRSLGDKNVLTWMGTMLEKFLTLPEEEFKRLLHSSPTIEPDLRREAFRFSKVGSFVMRSQLDCWDHRLPGTGVFDLKTRAAMPIRYDLMNWEENSSYLIHQQHGMVESFEREYYDLIRAAFLKYSFQVRIGNMDGVMVAYHNTARIFGFQYIPLEEMDERLYGNKHAGPPIFEKCVGLLQVISDEITQQFPEQSVRCLWDSKPEEGTLSIWVQPFHWSGAGVTPMAELEVTLHNFLDDEYVPGHAVADHLPDKAWSVRYRIRVSASPIAEIRERYEAAVNKQKFIFELPSGVNLSDMAELWQQLDYGNEDKPSSAFDPALFKSPSASTLRTRRLAQRGSDHLKRIAKEDEGKPVHVYTMPGSDAVASKNAAEST